MNCDECQIGLCDDDAAAGADAESARHLEGCPACRRFRDAWERLDLALAAGAAEERMPGDFRAALFARLPPETPRLLPMESAERRADLEREYKAARVALQRRYLLVPVALVPRIAGVFAGVEVVVALIRTSSQTIGPALAAAEGSATVAGASIAAGCAALFFGLARVWPSLRRIPRGW